MKAETLSVVKIGGNIIEDQDKLSAFLDLFAGLQAPKILVHGGGNRATELAGQMGVRAQIVDGRRITDAPGLEIALMVYAGLINKNIVACLQARACNAIGLSGADGNAIVAHRRPVKEIDFGFVGDVDKVNQNSVTALLHAGLVPVFCALTHDGQGQMLNTNADTIASEIAIAMSALYTTTLFYCFEKQGVLMDRHDEASVIRHIDANRYRELLDNGNIADGMLPKMENCFHALKRQVAKVCIGDMRMLQPGYSHYTTITL